MGGDGILKNVLSRSGGYRQVFVLERQFTSNSEEVILKSMKRFQIGSGNLEQRAVERTIDTSLLSRVLTIFSQCIQLGKYDFD